MSDWVSIGTRIFGNKHENEDVYCGFPFGSAGAFSSFFSLG